MPCTCRHLAAAITLIALVSLVVSAGEVPLRVDVPPGMAQGRWPVTVGVPFAEGVLRAGAAATVMEDGRAIPTQSIPLATWDKGGTSVRWLLIDFHVDAAKARGAKYSLQFADGASRPAGQGIPVRRRGDRLVIDTGAAEFIVRDRGVLRVESVKTGDGGGVFSRRPQLVSPEGPIRFVIEDHTGRVCEASGDLTPDGAVIEDHGPCRVGIKSEGWYRAADGTGFCKHVVRLEFFAASSMLRVLHTFIFTGTSDSHQIRDMAMDVPTTLRSKVVGSIGTSAEDPSASLDVLQPDPFHLTQDCKDRWRPQFTVAQTATGRELAAGERAGGWCRVTAKEGAVTAALREAWQNYPNEMEIDGGTLRVHFWPRHGRLMDMRTPALLAPYGEDGLGIIDRFFLKQHPPYARSIHDVYNNAMGVAKTHEVWLDFSVGREAAARTAEIVTQANHPVLAVANPAWNCASGALGPMHPQDRAQFPEVESALEAMFDRFVNWQRHFMDYGWFDYGDIHNDARDWTFGNKFAGGRTATLWRYWDSTHYGFPNSPWLLWFRSGDRKYLEFAEANARHCMDIDRCHFGDGKDRHKGGHYYCDWSIIHWTGRTETHINYDKLEYMLYAYYMRGYRRGLEVMKDWADLHLRCYRDGKDQDPFQMMLPAKTRIKDIRHYGPPLGNMTELYRATWNERYLNAAKDWAAALVEMCPMTDDGWKDLGEIQFCWEAMNTWADFVGDRSFRESLTAYARAGVNGRHDSGSFGDAVSGYVGTGDTRFLDAGKARLMQLLSCINTSDDARARGSTGSWSCGSHPYSMRSLPFFVQAMASAPQEWRELNLPLIATNRTMHMAGPRLPVLHVKSSGGTATLHLRLGLKQALSLTGADGGALSHIEAATPPQVSVIRLPEGATGTHVIRFPLRPTRREGDYIERGNVDVVGVENARLTVAPCTEDGKFCVFGPRFHFMVPPGTEEFVVDVDTSTTWAAYAWFPIVSVYRPDGTAVETRKGPGLMQFKVTPRPDDTGKLWSLGPLGRVSATSVNATWLKPVRPFDAHFPAWFRLSPNLPQFVSTHPSLFFIPTKDDRGEGG
jgi:hypothetical protein